jgi:hypothetical protein
MTEGRTKAQMWSTIMNLLQHIEESYDNLKQQHIVVDELLIARAEIVQVSADMDVLMSIAWEKR